MAAVDERMWGGMRVISRMFVAGTIGVAVAGAASVGVAIAATEDVPTENNGGSIVEDFSYPGAAAILAEHNVELISGDGHIVFADCNTPPVNDVGVIQVWTSELSQGRVCFKALGPVGRLDLRIPAVFEIHGDGQRRGTGHNGTATVITESGDETTKDLIPDGSTQFGEGTGPGNEPTTLLQLTVKP
uniref:Secreted protein n=1 Tax=Salinispora arenicola (strain CNS-205) TaxID=391037 RepID=A8LW41_SALAI